MELLVCNYTGHIKNKKVHLLTLDSFSLDPPSLLEVMFLSCNTFWDEKYEQQNLAATVLFIFLWEPI